MSTFSDRRTLCLNADFRPLSVYPLSLISPQDAICAVLKGHAYVVEEYPEIIRSPSTEINIPKIIALQNYTHISAIPKFCRRNVLLRDKFRCQYCGHKFTSEDLTFDHVLPRSRGGQTTWQNIVMACVECNKNKRDRLIQPLRAPHQPTSHELLASGLEFLDPKIRAEYQGWLGDVSDEYWESELET